MGDEAGVAESGAGTTGGAGAATGPGPAVGVAAGAGDAGVGGAGGGLPAGPVRLAGESERWKEKGVRLRVIFYILGTHVLAGFLWLLFYVGAHAGK